MGSENHAAVRSTRVNSFTVAQMAGVSQSTVSRVLSGKANVSEETRRHVLGCVQRLGYEVDKAASSLRRRLSSTLALLFFEDPTADDSLINPFFLTMLGAITRACAGNDYDLLISFQHHAGNWHTDYENCRKADGIILLGYGDYLTFRPMLERLLQQGTHFVRYGAVVEGQPGLLVGCDNFQGGRDATRHLISLGRRDIAFLGHASGRYPEFSERYRGYAEALRQSGLQAAPALQADAVSTESAGHGAARTLLERGVPFDAVFAASDLIAIGAMQAFKEAHLEVPEAVAVAGFDDIPAARLTEPPLTTVMQDTQRAGEALVETLLKLVRGEAAQSIVLPAPLVVRRSSGAAR
jgi:DNA-binding LacI/PurR family transcriptional regulator